MGPHPIPQNVTSFQFHLIGDMTIGQFIYLAAGAVIAYIIFVFFVNSYPYVAWPLILISGGTGAAFAFVPIGSRPLDHWLKAFLKAVSSPTQRYWVKDDKKYSEQPLFNSRYVIFKTSFVPTVQSTVAVTAKTSLQQKMAPPQPQPQTQTIQPAFNPLRTPVAQAVQNTSATLPTSEELKKTVELARQAQSLQVQIIQTERTLNQIKSAANKPSAIPVNYTQEVNKILEDLQILVTQASEIKTKLNSIGGEKNAEKLELNQLKERVKIVIPEKPKQTQIVLTTFPNVISGIIKDASGNYLEAVVAVIYDKEGLPVRALKTNKLGQFSGSTPLSNGTYTLELEKEGYTFDTLQIDLDGHVMPPLPITAKL